MSRHLFGWSLPPGVSIRDIDPPEQPCSICGEFSDRCICPECPTCNASGDPECYRNGHLEFLPQRWFVLWASMRDTETEQETAVPFYYDGDALFVELQAKVLEWGRVRGLSLRKAGLGDEATLSLNALVEARHDCRVLGP